MFYYFDKTTHRCFMTCSMPMVNASAYRIEASDGYSNYPLPALIYENGNVVVDEEMVNMITMEELKGGRLRTIDTMLLDIDGFERYENVDVAEAKEALLLCRHKTVTAVTPNEVPSIPTIKKGLLIKGEENE